MKFGEAINELKNGNRVCRAGWNGKDMYLYQCTMELDYPPLPDGCGWKSDTFGESTFIVMKTADDKLIPWLASQTDVLASDWEFVSCDD